MNASAVAPLSATTSFRGLLAWSVIAISAPAGAADRWIPLDEETARASVQMADGTIVVGGYEKCTFIKPDGTVRIADGGINREPLLLKDGQLATVTPEGRLQFMSSDGEVLSEVEAADLAGKLPMMVPLELPGGILLFGAEIRDLLLYNRRGQLLARVPTAGTPRTGTVLSSGTAVVTTGEYFAPEAEILFLDPQGQVLHREPLADWASRDGGIIDLRDGRLVVPTLRISGEDFASWTTLNIFDYGGRRLHTTPELPGNSRKILHLRSGNLLVYSLDVGFQGVHVIDPRGRLLGSLELPKRLTLRELRDGSVFIFRQPNGDAGKTSGFHLLDPSGREVARTSLGALDEQPIIEEGLVELPTGDLLLAFWQELWTVSRQGIVKDRRVLSDLPEVLDYPVARLLPDGRAAILYYTAGEPRGMGVLFVD
jgi:hypothetical protein